MGVHVRTLVFAAIEIERPSANLLCGTVAEFERQPVGKPDRDAA
jgi:hypothetical protein